MTAAIHFQSEAYSTSGKKLMGRNAAGESFLRGLVRSRPAGDLWAFVESPSDGEAFIETARSLGSTGNTHIIDPGTAARLRQPGTLFNPGPNFSKHAWRRSLFGDGSWSLCGITHTIASGRAMDSIVDLVTAPTAPWDALICTSHAVRDSVASVLEAQARYLTDRFGAKTVPLPKLPVIPLGLNADEFDYSADERTAARAQLNIGDDEDVVLFTGRLSFHAKAHPLAMYQALERAQRRREAAGRKTVLIECGWHATDRVARAFADARRMACPEIRTIELDGRIAADRRKAWACADIVSSLVDNIQETFGIVPVEAMAAGLPVVVSDWDGYRDTVRDRVDGFRIPTVSAAVGFGEDLARRHALEIDSYDWYLAYSSSFTAVDIEAATEAFAALLGSPEMRLRMGEQGRQRARELFDWSVVLTQYEELWQELADLRRTARPGSASHGWPARLDPFDVFSGYPTSSLKRDSVVQLIDTSAEAAKKRLEQYLTLEMVGFAGPVLPETVEIHLTLDGLEQGPRAAGELIGSLPAAHQDLGLRGLVWLMKLGVVGLSSPAPLEKK